jgi:hypothetical protein
MNPPVNHMKPIASTRKSAARATPHPYIVVKCERPVIGARYVQINYKANRLEFLYMQAEKTPGGQLLRYRQSECIFFADAPEARLIYDGAAWDLDEIRAWLEYLTWA